MEAKRFWFIFGVVLLLSAIGELLLIFAAAYVAILVYTKSTFLLNYFIALCVVGGVFVKIIAGIIKKNGLNM